MRFVIDLDSLYLIESPTDRRPVSSVLGKRGDDSPFEVVFVRSGVAEELAAETVLTFGAKELGKYDGTAVVLNSDFTLSGTGDTAKYLASPSFNTEELNGLFLIDADDSNDPEYKDLMAEFTWQVGDGPPSSCKTFRFRVYNDVIRGTEGTPLALPTPEEWLAARAMPPAIIRTAAEGVPVDEEDAVTGTAQVERADVNAASGATSTGSIDVTITAADLPGSPLIIPVTITNGVDTSQGLIAEKIEAAIAANAVAAAFLTPSAQAPSSSIYFTRTTKAANDATFNVAIGAGHGVTAAPTSTNMQGGVAPVIATTATAIGQKCVVGDDGEGDDIGNGSRLIHTATSISPTIWTLTGGRNSAGLSVTVFDDPETAGNIVVLKTVGGLVSSDTMTPETFLTA